MYKTSLEIILGTKGLPKFTSKTRGKMTERNNTKAIMKSKITNVLPRDPLPSI